MTADKEILTLMEGFNAANQALPPTANPYSFEPLRRWWGEGYGKHPHGKLFTEGFQAARNGRPGNPYTTEPEHTWWREGWAAGLRVNSVTVADRPFETAKPRMPRPANDQGAA